MGLKRRPPKRKPMPGYAGSIKSKQAAQVTWGKASDLAMSAEQYHPLA